MTDPRLILPPFTANQKLVEDAIRHFVFLERFKNGEAAKIVRFLDEEVYPDLLGRLRDGLEGTGRGYDVSLIRTERGRNLMSGMMGTLKAGHSAAYDKLKDTLRDFTISEAEWQAAAMEAAAGQFDIVFDTPNLPLLRSIVTDRPMEGALLKDWFGGLAQTTQRNVVKQVNVGMASGESIEDIVGRVRGTRTNSFKDGVLEISRKDAKNVVRTAVAHVGSHAREETYAENADMIKGVKMVATLDARTTPFCQKIDGQVFPTGKGQRPPFHFSCRTVAVPVLKSWKDLGIRGMKEFPESTRASMDGQVPANVTYNTWLKRQTKSLQEEILGKEKTKIFRRGNLDVRDFVNEEGRTLTLDELRKAEAPYLKKKAGRRKK